MQQQQAALKSSICSWQPKSATPANYSEHEKHFQHYWLIILSNSKTGSQPRPTTTAKITPTRHNMCLCNLRGWIIADSLKIISWAILQRGACCGASYIVYFLSPVFCLQFLLFFAVFTYVRMCERHLMRPHRLKKVVKIKWILFKVETNLFAGQQQLPIHWLLWPTCWKLSKKKNTKIKQKNRWNSFTLCCDLTLIICSPISCSPFRINGISSMKERTQFLYIHSSVWK